jgi:hypothetical protein
MFHAIFVMFEGTPGIVRGINKDALDSARKFLFEGLESEKVVPEDEPVIENIVLSQPVRRMIGLFRVLKQNPRFQLRPVLLPDPCEFEFGFMIDHYVSFKFLLYVVSQTQDETTDFRNHATHLPVLRSLPSDSHSRTSITPGYRECIDGCDLGFFVADDVFVIIYASLPL